MKTTEPSCTAATATIEQYGLKLAIQQLSQSISAMVWIDDLMVIGTSGNWQNANWAYTILKFECCAQVRSITERGGLLLISGVYLNMDRAAS